RASKAMSADRPDVSSWYQGLPLSARRHTIAGVVLLMLTVGGFGAWAAMAPLHGAVLASGSFVATGQNKLVQHLEGGIIRELLVGEGDEVERGQVLAKIDDTGAHDKLT